MLATAQPVTFAGLELIEDRWWNLYTDGSRLPFIAGGADDDDDSSDDDDSDADGDSSDDDTDVDGADKLGDAGKKALDAMKGKWHSERDRRKAMAKPFTDLGLTPEQAAEKLKELLGDKSKSKGKKDDGGSDDQPDSEQIREQARREARAEAMRDRSVDRIEARAGRTFEIEVDGKKTKIRFADPEDAVAFLRDKAADFVDGDKVDTEAIDEALVELLGKKPRLGEAVDGKKKFDGDADAGARKSTERKPIGLAAAVGKHYDKK